MRMAKTTWRTFWAVLALLVAMGPAAAQSDRIERVIGAQIEAFLADDFERAFDFASPGIRDVFRTPENFGRMVRQGYPMVWRPERFRFEALEDEGGRLRQEVFITDRAGKAWIADYYMVQVEGEWRIDGVSLREAPGLGA
ncbi:MAG: DUF4864 domain-containing protein [Paracoccaceae bacterium]